MSIFLAIAATGITYLSGQDIQLTPSEASDRGIDVSVTNLEAEYQHPYPLFLFNIDLRNFDQCVIRDVSIEIGNNQGQLVFASGINGQSGIYTFQLIEMYLNSAALAVHCDAEPDALDPSYTIELGSYRRTP